MQRIFDGEFIHGEMHFLANTLKGEGAETILHRHKYPHVALFGPGEPNEAGELEYEVFAIRSTGEEVFMPLDAWGFVYIEKGIDHRVRLKRGKAGKFVCMFCRVNPDGSPRRWALAAPEEE